MQHIGVGAGTFLGVRRIFARILPNVPEKKTKGKVTSKKIKKLALHVISGGIFGVAKCNFVVAKPIRLTNQI